MYRRTATRVVGGKVQRKNRAAVTPSYYNTPQPLPLFDRRKPGLGCRHVLRKSHVIDFISIIPHWDELSVGINAIVLGPWDERRQGYHQAGVIHVLAVPRSLELELYSSVFDYCCGWILRRMCVPYETVQDDLLRFRFSEDSLRAYQLMDIFIHELGHHRDIMTNRSRADYPRGEPYAVEYARKHGPQLWDRYIEVFGNPIHSI